MNIVLQLKNYGRLILTLSEKSVEGNLAEQSKLARDHMAQQAQLEKLQRALLNDLRRRSEGE
jgi:hypothetical protein